MKWKSKGLDGCQLRVLALGLMTLDHVGAVFFPQMLWMRAVGRLAFPIFAFQTVEGYHHTHDISRYALRLLVCGLLSEIPFDLMTQGVWVSPYHQNVMFTLLLGLLALPQVDRLTQATTPDSVLRPIGILCLVCLAGILGLTDYGLLGIFTVVCFHLFRDNKPGQLLSLGLIHVFGFTSQGIPLGETCLLFPIQGFALLSLGLIWQYHGEKGPGKSIFRWFCYLYYPLHMLLIWYVASP